MFSLAFGFGGPQDMVIIAIVVLLLFGGSKLAGFGKSLGEGIKEFKKATHEDETPPAPPAVTTSSAPTAVVTKPEEK